MKMIAVCTLLVCLLLASVCWGDVVTLKDGTVYEGVIIKETGAQVTMEVTIANIKTTKTFPRYKVKSIERKPMEVESEKDDDQDGVQEDAQNTARDEDADTARKDNSDARRTPRSRRGRAEPGQKTSYMVIPVEGMIGMNTNATGLEKALKQAKSRRIEHIVFMIDSGGGYVYDAVATLKVLKEYDDDLIYHALVEEGAISAASVYVAAADDIFVRPDARVGGAVAYSKDNSSGATEVDAKMNSIWAAEIAARAESKGFPAEVFHAMVVLEAEVWIDDENKVFSSRPRSGGQQIDSSGTILTIRASQMVQIGMATEFKGELSELGELLGLENWSEARGMGQRIMTASAKERVKLQERFDFAIEAFADAMETFEASNPQSFSDYMFYRQGDGSLFPDGDSVQLWRRRSQESLQACNIMLEALGHLASVNKKARKIEALHLDRIPDSIGHDAFTTIREARDYLQANQNMIPRGLFR